MSTALERLEVQLQAGCIQRYHLLPIIGEQNVAAHTYGVCQILRFISGDELTPRMLMAALDHDVAEYEIGDIPFNVKRAYPHVKEALVAAEQDFEQKFGLNHPLGEREKQLVKQADVLEMGFFGKRQYQLGNEGGLTIMYNVLEALHKMNVGGKALILFDQLARYYEDVNGK